MKEISFSQDDVHNRQWSSIWWSPCFSKLTALGIIQILKFVELEIQFIDYQFESEPRPHLMLKQAS